MFFSRPARDTEMRALTELSPAVAEAVTQSGDPDKYNTGQTAGAWFARRIRNQRIKNRTASDICLKRHLSADM